MIENSPGQLPARLSRLSGEEIRSRMMTAAFSHVSSHGVMVSFDGLQFEEIITEAGVSRSSAYRIWENRSAFTEDLLIELARFSAENLRDASVMVSTLNIVESQPALYETAAGRETLLHDAIRSVLEDNYYSTIDSTNWQSFLSVSATLLGTVRTELRVRLEEAIRRGSSDFIDAMALAYEQLCSLLGFRLRREFDGGFRLFATLSSAIVEGLTVRHLANPSMTDNVYQRHPIQPSKDDKWSPAAIGFLALFNQFLEPDPDFNPASIPFRLNQIRTTAQS